MARPAKQAAAMFGGLAMLASTSATAAESARIGWSTYLRSGPGQAYQAIEELDHDTAVALVRCEGAWCRVVAGTATGFVDRAALTLPRPSPPQGLKARPDCFTSGQADYHGQMPTRFCGKAGG